MPSHPDIVRVAVAGSEVEGRMWADALRNAGLHVMVKAGGPGAGAWASVATFEHAIFVRADERQRARSILAPWLHPGGVHEGPRARSTAPRINRRVKSGT